MKRSMKLLILILSAVLALTAFVSCSKDDGDAVADDPATASVRALISAYYNDINSGNYDSIGKYFGSEITDIQAKIDNFKFIDEYYEDEYEIEEVTGIYLEDGSISASVTTIRSSVDKKSGKKTVVREPSTYIIGSETEGGDLVIKSMAIGESSVIELET